MLSLLIFFSLSYSTFKLWIFYWKNKYYWYISKQNHTVRFPRTLHLQNWNCLAFIFILTMQCSAWGLLYHTASISVAGQRTNYFHFAWRRWKFFYAGPVVISFPLLLLKCTNEYWNIHQVIRNLHRCRAEENPFSFFIQLCSQGIDLLTSKISLKALQSINAVLLCCTSPSEFILISHEHCSVCSQPQPSFSMGYMFSF